MQQSHPHSTVREVEPNRNNAMAKGWLTYIKLSIRNTKTRQCRKLHSHTPLEEKCSCEYKSGGMMWVIVSVKQKLSVYNDQRKNSMQQPPLEYLITLTHHYAALNCHFKKSYTFK